jgi:hypothetical protein
MSRFLQLLFRSKKLYILPCGILIERLDASLLHSRFQNMAFFLTLALALSCCFPFTFASPTCDQLATSGITVEPYLSLEYDYDQSQYW